MAHELARKADGSGAMFSVGATPWHRLGRVLTRPPRNMEEALAVAGLDFEVELRPVSIQSSRGESGRSGWVTVPDQLASCRTDTGQVLGIVGSRYRPLQNRDAFRVLEPMLDSGKATLETGGALREGRDVWLLVRFAVDDPVVREVFADEVVPFGLLSNNHAGQRRVTLQETPIRVVCANTLGAAHRSAREGKVFRVLHTVNVEVRAVEAAQQLWGALIERYRAVADQYQALRRCFIDEAAFQALVLDVVAPIRPQWLSPRTTPMQKQALERACARRHRVRDLWTGGEGHTGEQSAWEAYNGVVQSIDHDPGVWAPPEKQLASLFDGELARRKQEVLDGLVEHADGIRPLRGVGSRRG